MMREFVRIGWHMDGLSWDAYLDLLEWERAALLVELDELIGRANETGNMRPKDTR